MSIPDAIHAQTVQTVPHGSWTLVGVKGGKLVLNGTGVGVDSLRNALADNECAYALLSLRVEMQGVPDQPRHIFIQWKGPSASAMKKVQANQVFQEAMNVLAPNHGQLEAIGKSTFDEATIALKWRPEAGSHVID
eukprot:m51a1_g2659 hypothetical protein (135) ;mRNA; f:642498-643265